MKIVYKKNALSNTVPEMTGATSSTAGSGGLVPAPLAADVDKFLKGDGTWAESKSSSNFTGTLAEWNNLTQAEQEEYDTVDLEDDYNGWPIDNVPTQNSNNLVKSGGVKSYVDIAVEDKADKVSNATSGNFAGLDSSGNLTDSGSKASDFLSSRYLETSVKTTADGKDTFTFSDAAITSTASFDVYSDVFAAPIVDMVLSGTQLTVSYNSSDNVGTCRLYIK